MQKVNHLTQIGKLFLSEAKKPQVYGVAILVGTFLTLTKGIPELAYLLPFLVPLLVGLGTRTATRYFNKEQELLVQLPAFRKDPVLVVGSDGEILASTGNTKALFSAHGITHLGSFFDQVDSGNLVDLVQEPHPFGQEPQFYSSITNAWYRIEMRQSHHGSYWLAWLENISATKHLEEQRKTLREFTHRLQKELIYDGSTGDDDSRLANLVLAEGYQAVMLARLDPKANDPRTRAAQGTIHLQDGQRVGPLDIPSGIDAPIMASRKLGYAIWDSVTQWKNPQEFYQTYRVLPQVSQILDRPLVNFANYHSGDVSIIAFNKTGEISTSDLSLLESAADSAVNAFSLLDLARRADQRFIQSITGLCAAAEFSDELTGSHIYRVNHYAQFLAKQLGLEEQFCKDLGTVAALHDIGKVAIPHIIKLQRALNPTERQIMEMHPIIGAQILEKMILSSQEPEPRLSLAKEIALHHHQHWDGSGYPRILGSNAQQVFPLPTQPGALKDMITPRGDQIPLSALIVSLADKYDALRSARQYKPAFDHEKALELLALDDRSGKTGWEVFGPQVYQGFQDHHQGFEEIYQTYQGEPYEL